MNKIQGFRDRGAAKHFHGRKTILLEFQKALAESMESKGGTIFLIQGPPGVGKTALLAKCWDEAEERGWGVAEIDPGDLWNPDELRKTLGLPPQERKVGKTTGWGLDKIFNFSRKTETEINAPLDTPADILKLKTAPVLLILDEAQRLGENKNVNGPYKDKVSDLLTKIHNGGIGKPVILLAGGLGLTEEAFVALGISRMAEKCKFDMKPLKKEEERAVIHAWLTKEGEARGDLTEWTDAISQETHCWPRHIHSYATCAAHVLKQSGREMTEEGLRIVMEKGLENRWAYYTGRTEGLDGDHIVRLVEMFRDTPVEEGFRKQDLVAELGEPGFAQAVSKGVLYYSNPLYTLPIPSLYDYLTERATRIREAALRYERVKKQRQASRHLTRGVSEQQPELKGQSEAEGSQKEAGNHTPDSPSPEKEEGKEPAILKSEKGNPGQEPPQGRDPSNSDQDTDMRMDR